MPHFLLVASTTIKSKREDPHGKRIFRTAPEQIFINAVVVVPGRNSAADDSCVPVFVRGVRRRASVIDALSPGSGLPNPWGGALPARVAIAEAAVAGNHLLHAHLEASHAAILVHDPSADIRQRAPRTLIGLAWTQIKGRGRRHGSQNEHESHSGPPTAPRSLLASRV